MGARQVICGMHLGSLHTGRVSSVSQNGSARLAKEAGAHAARRGMSAGPGRMSRDARTV